MAEQNQGAVSAEGKLKTTLEVDISGLEGQRVKAADEALPVVTEHCIAVKDGTISYTACTGRMPLLSDTGEVEARVFFVAYSRTDAGPSEDRPLIFSFNGGPGSSSVWLHLGAVGPKRVRMQADGQMPPPPFRLEDNPLTWLEDADLVFIDPVGTGYSRPEKADDGKKYWGLKGDIASVGQFITRYLTKYNRWSSPLFLVGESYGTTRAAGLAGYLIEHGVAFNGIMLVSSILQFQTAQFHTGNDLPYLLFLPTYTATAWYHGKLEPAYQANLEQTLAEVEAWALGDYARALAAGDALGEEATARIAKQLSRFTGLSETYVLDSNLRIQIFRFCKELLRDQRRTVGRLDSRFKGIDGSIVTDGIEFDPSMAAIRPPYTATFNDYVRRQLGYETDLTYHILGGGIKTPWEWDSNNSYVETGDALRAGMARNPHMKLFVASGYYDLATPYFATDYTLTHLGLDEELRSNITTARYAAGHMMYIDVAELERLKRDVAEFIRTTLDEHRGK